MDGSRVALVVATDNYADPTLHGLAAPAADADALADVLGDERLGGFDVEVLRNAASYTIAERVEGLFGDRRPSDVVVLHFSCHGIKDESGELFLAATNTVPDRLASTAVDAGLVNRLMGRSRARSIVLLLDCCYGGAFERGLTTRGDGDVHVGDQFDPVPRDSGRGRVVITASSAMEYALEGTALTSGGKPAPSLFTGALTQGIRSGEADRDQDGRVCLNELYDFVYDTVRERTPNQTPSRWDFGVQGDVFIARSPRRRIVPGPLPGEILELVEHTAAGVRLGAVGELAGLATRSHLPTAAAAVAALRHLTDDDSRRVSGAASAALDTLRPSTDPTTVDLGRVPAGTSALTATVDVTGGPLALASEVRTTTSRLHARLDGSVLRVEVDAGPPGVVSGAVTLTGPAGDTNLLVNATVVPPAESTGPPPAEPEPAPEPELDPAPQPAPQPAPGPPGPPVAATGAVLVPLLVLLGAAVTVVANLGPSEYDGFVAIGVTAGMGWLYVPAVASMLAAGALVADRWVPAAVGLVAGAAFWSAAWWWRLTVSGLFTDGVGVGGTVAGTLNTGLWARLLAAILLGAAVVVTLRRSPGLSRPVAFRRDRWAVLGAVVVTAGCVVYLVEPLATGRADGVPRLVALATATFVCCLPVAALRLNRSQRRAALVAAGLLLGLVAARDGWLLVTTDPGADGATHFALIVAGSLVVLGGCLLGQGPRRP